MLNNFKWTVMLAVIAVTFAGIYGIYNWRQQHIIQEPLIESLLDIEGVSKVNINVASAGNAGRIEDVTVCLHYVEHLPEAYQEIEETLNSVLEEGSYKLLFCEPDDEYLVSVYNKIHFILFEGERLGNYNQMYDNLNDELINYDGINSFQLWVDQERIYFQLNSEGGVMNKVIPIKRVIEAN